MWCRSGTLGDDMLFFSSRRRHTRLQGDWSSDVCSSDLRKAYDALVSATSRLRTAHRQRLTGKNVDVASLEARQRDAHRAAMAAARQILTDARSEERRVGEECRTRWAA